MLRKIISHSAHQSIQSKNSTFQFPRTVTWWNQNLSVFKKGKSSKWSILKRNIITYNIVENKRGNAKLKKAIREAKRFSIFNFTSDISPFSSPARTWSNIRRLCGLYPTKHTYCINDPSFPTPRTSQSEIANSFGLASSKEADDGNFSPTFRTNKFLLSHTIDYQPSKTAIEIEKDILFIEFSCALNFLKGKLQT